jgi:DNA-binding transcriptional regulator YiaG
VRSEASVERARLDEAAGDVHGALRLLRRLGIGQIAFANRYRLAPGTLRTWEQGRSEPDRSAKVLLAAISADPDGVARAATHAGDPCYLAAGPSQAA